MVAFGCRGVVQTLCLEVGVSFSCCHFWLCDVGRLPNLSKLQ